MDFSISIQNAEWQPVIEIPLKTALVTGRPNPWYDKLTRAAAEINAACGCYSWQTANGSVLYVGIFSPYQNKAFKSSFHGRVHNYFKNHRVTDKGTPNTNLAVFNNLNMLLQQSTVVLAYLGFDDLYLANEVISFAQFSCDPTLTHAVEELLICTYRHADQCKWNKT